MVKTTDLLVATVPLIQFSERNNRHKYQSRYSLRVYRQGYPKRCNSKRRNLTSCRLPVIKRYKDADGNWQDKTQWHIRVVYGPTADYARRSGRKPCIP